MRIVQGPGADETSNPFLLSEQEEKVVKKKQRENQHGLTVPRRSVSWVIDYIAWAKKADRSRPAWTRHTTRQELEKQERESFLDWRRDLAKCVSLIYLVQRRPVQCSGLMTQVGGEFYTSHDAL